ncbi:MAG TPA: hypothetical protein VK009_03505 [Chloroflexota bacterium]|nr:hypothetical protein [Chloroflexota bacterium]
MSRGCASLLEPGCPVPRAHQRLEDAHRLWHQAVACYADPAAFRDGLNDALQALRGGTWALQQETRSGLEFQAWHDLWHRRIRGDEVLHWLVQTHRHSVTEQDLEPASTANVKLIVQQDGAEQELAAFTVPPMVAPEHIPRQLSATRMGPIVKMATVMVVERQWRALDLGQWELLEALAHCWGILADPLQDVHAQHGCELERPPEPEPDPLTGIPSRLPGQPECMTVSARNKVSFFKLEEGRFMGQEQTSLDGEEGIPQLSADQAGNSEIEELDQPKQRDPLRRMAWFFEDARRQLEAEGAYEQRVSLYTTAQEWTSMVLSAADKQDRYQLWARVAREVERTGAEAVLTIFFETASRRPGEGQRLVLAAEAADGRHRTFSASVERRAGQIHFGRTRFDEDGRRWYFLDPIRETWRTAKRG